MATPKAKEPETAAKTLTGFASVRAAVAKVTGIQEADLPKDEGIYWFETLQADLKRRGWRVQREDGDVSVQAAHVGLFADGEQLNGAVFEGDSNTTTPDAQPRRLVQRLRFTQDQKQED